ncbi:hypothetical protein Prudu_339S000300 [Prunus dulcis]|uniref:Glycosyl transferase CAP10 domain-containing protein n=1 Tax=Prunus dulcis TaxID=3755 RepID=A0A5H2Y0C0_PRUDU|nr:hypothetical protein Prudu_339S000300 [Prunus dulcis]
MLVKLLGPRSQKLETIEWGLPVTLCTISPRSVVSLYSFSSKESLRYEGERESNFRDKYGFIFSGANSKKSITTTTNTSTPKRPEFPLQCTKGINVTQSCPRTYPTTHNPPNPSHPSNHTCPSYFRWIHEDLRPWKETGITRDMIKQARKIAHFRLLIVDGKAFIEKYSQSFQTRDMFTLWGILQLLRVYPGRLPDLELMFNCGDQPSSHQRTLGARMLARHRCFDTARMRELGYCVPRLVFLGLESCVTYEFRFYQFPILAHLKSKESKTLAHKLWANFYFGRVETNVKPWRSLLQSIKEGNKRTKWEDRVPYAYWKGNPNVARTRMDLLKCNVSDKNDWNTRLYIQNWEQESKQGFKDSNLENQCKHRPRYHDFFMRGMEPLQHFWPIRDNSKCTSLKFAVEWGNNHKDKAKAIGEAASNFIQEDLKMDYVYDYMFHVLNEYAKLLKFKPTIPPNAVELCSEKMACLATGTCKKFMVESMVGSPSDELPCTLPPPYDPLALHDFLVRKANSTRQVEAWENEYWQSIEKRQ